MRKLHDAQALSDLLPGSIIVNGSEPHLIYFVLLESEWETVPTPVKAYDWVVHHAWYLCDSMGNIVEFELESYPEVAEYHNRYGFRSEAIHLPAYLYAVQ